MSTRYLAQSRAAPVRCFLALPLEQTQRLQLVQRQQILRDALPDASLFRFTEPQSFHLTLRFFGEIESGLLNELQNVISEATRDIAPFALQISGIGCFPNPRSPRVLWAGVSGELVHLKDLQSRIAQQTGAFGAAPEAREFQPHLTLARRRFKTARDQKSGAQERQTNAHPMAEAIRIAVEKSAQLENESWYANELLLMRSELARDGARYSALATFPFHTSSS